MNTHDEYLKKIEPLLSDLSVYDRSKLLCEIHKEIERLELTDLKPALAFANEKRSEYGYIPFKPVKKMSFLSFFLKFSAMMTLLFLGSISLLVWKFTPIFKVDEETNRVIILGGLIDINAKAGKLKVLDNYHYSDDSFTNDFQASINLNQDKDEVIVNFQSGRFDLKNATDDNFTLDCKLATPPTDEIISEQDDLVVIDFKKTPGLNCTLAVPVDKKITIEGLDASIRVPSPEYNLYVELDSGKVYLTPEEEIDYNFNLNIDETGPENYIGDFQSNDTDEAFEIRINLKRGAIIRK